MNKNKDLHAFLRVPDNGTKGTKRNKVWGASCPLRASWCCCIIFIVTVVLKKAPSLLNVLNKLGAKKSPAEAGLRGAGRVSRLRPPCRVRHAWSRV